MKCKNCGSEEFTVMTTMLVSMPFEMYHKLTKKKMRDKEFKIWGVRWGKADFICKNCGLVIERGDV